jgi:hypothetical protein
MTLRTKRRWLWTCSGLLAAIGLASVAALVAVPVGDSGADAVVTAPVEAPPPPARKMPLSAYEAASRRNLLQPLFDTGGPGQTAAKPTVKLVGTIIEKEQSFAMLKGKDGQVHWASVGESVDGAEVTEIKTDSVTVKFADQLHALKVESQGSGT